MLEPLSRISNFCGDRRQPDRFVATQILAGESLKQFSSVGERQFREAFAVFSGQQVEYNQHRWCFSSEALHATLRRVNTLQQVVERKSPSLWHDNFTVEHETLRLQRSNRRNQFRKIAGERLAGFRLQFDLSVVAKYQAAEAVPFRLVLPVLALWNLVHGQGFHRREGRVQSEGHHSINAKRPALGRPFREISIGPLYSGTDPLMQFLLGRGADLARGFLAILE